MFAGPDGAGQDQILGRGDPLTARKRVNLCRTDALGGGEIKGLERLDLREAGLTQSLPDHGLVPRALLGAEHLVEILLVRPVGVARLTGQAFKDACDAGHLQRTRLRHDEIASDDGRGHAGAPVSQRS